MNITQIKQDIDFLVDTDDNVYLPADKIRNVNLAFDEISGIILEYDENWRWHDTNYTTEPIGEINLVSGTQKYDLPELLNVNAVEIKDANDNYIKLSRINSIRETETITDISDTQGTPQYYDLIGKKIYLYPTPNYNKTGGLKIWLGNKGEWFTTSDTTKTPGIASNLTRFFSVSAAYDWAVAKQHPKMNWLLNEKNRFIEMIKKHYSKRNKDERPRIIPVINNTR